MVVGGNALCFIGGVLETTGIEIVTWPEEMLCTRLVDRCTLYIARNYSQYSNQLESLPSELQQKVIKLHSHISGKGVRTSVCPETVKRIRAEQAALAEQREKERASWQRQGERWPQLISEGDKEESEEAPAKDTPEEEQKPILEAESENVEACNALDGGTWACFACTFINNPLMTECEMCQTPKGL